MISEYDAAAANVNATAAIKVHGNETIHELAVIAGIAKSIAINTNKLVKFLITATAKTC